VFEVGPYLSRWEQLPVHSVGPASMRSRPSAFAGGAAQLGRVDCYVLVVRCTSRSSKVFSGLARASAAASAIVVVSPYQHSSVRQCRRNRASPAMPNPSLNLTHYGKQRKPGLQHASYPCSPGLRRSPPRSG
jgi:hypothetical protein